MDKQMRSVGMKMTFLMGVTMSIILSLVGTLTSGHFSLVSWIISFGISLGISIVIGFLIPVKRLGDMTCNKAKVAPNSLKGNLLSSLISDLIYTPLITTIMVIVMLAIAQKHAPAGAVPPVSRVLPGSLAITFIVGYVVIFIVQPLFLRTLLKNFKAESLGMPNP